MNVRSLGTASLLFVASVATFSVACSSSSKRGTFTEQDPTETGDAGAGSFITGDGGMGGTCGANPAEDKDYDGDGYTGKNDCNECDPNVNAGAFDVPGNGIDEDCNGTPDDELTACDDGLDIAGTAMEGAKAIGLCKEATDDQMWGVIKAEWVLPDGKTQKQPLSQGILSQFGVNAAQAGGSMLAISSGSARAPGDPGYHEPGDKTGFGGWDKGYTCGTPDGYPKESASCSGSGGGSFDKAHDGAALRVKIRVPSNAKSFKFQQNFFTFEFPDFICSTFNDFFVTMMDPAPSGLPDGNIAFDQDTNPISVNNSLLQVCSAQEAGGKDFSCPLGDSSLSGTGFEGHAATGWLTTTTPVDDVRGKEITLTWAVWDQGDGRLDSTALIDDFTWSVDAADGSKTVATPK